MPLNSPASTSADDQKQHSLFPDRLHTERTALIVLAVSLVITLLSWWLASDYVAA